MQRKMTPQERDRLEKQHRSWIRMIIEQHLYGGAIGVLTAWLIIHHDINRIGTMIGKSDNWLGYTFLLTFSFASFFGMIAAGVAVWLRAERENR